jgi:hypothetical protein
MKAELFISKNRVSYIVETLGADRVTVSEHDGDQDLVVFEVNSPLDLLYMFHAGIQYGSDSMAKALIKQ